MVHRLRMRASTRLSLCDLPSRMQAVWFKHDKQIMSSATRPSKPPGSRSGVYGLLFAIQTVGALIVLANGVPFYQRLESDFANHQPHSGIIWWAVASCLLIQGGYWLRVWLRPPFPSFRNIVLGHVISFIAQLSFILASSTFAAVFFVYFDKMSLPFHRICMMILLLFSLFCWSQELERLAKILQSKEEKSHQ